ncbi:MAG: adenine phosphoribosyltransferase [Myxococcota bacterium]
MSDPRIQRIEQLIRDVPDFPKPGILFKDITPLLADAGGFETALQLFVERFAERKPTVVAGIESRGFLFGAPLALRLGAAFVPIRKPGKLPYETVSQSYELEYGNDEVFMHVDAFEPGARVLLVDDLIATGGTAGAAAELIRRQKGDLVGAAFVIELAFLGGPARLQPTECYSILRIDGE